jgi:hypothetical protein
MPEADMNLDAKKPMVSIKRRCKCSAGAVLHGGAFGECPHITGFIGIIPADPALGDYITGCDIGPNCN